MNSLILICIHELMFDTEVNSYQNLYQKQFFRDIWNQCDDNDYDLGSSSPKLSSPWQRDLLDWRKTLYVEFYQSLPSYSLDPKFQPKRKQKGYLFMAVNLWLSDSEK